ncbi:MAG: hypothetical protein ACKO37_06680 [Vampirovibrionales bacterium]
MNKIIQKISGHEWSIILYIVLFLVLILFSKSLRPLFINLVSISLQKLVVLPILIATFYIFGELYLFYKLGWWSVDYVKATVVWLITFVWTVIFQVTSLENYKKVIHSIFTPGQILSFVFGLYSFPLIIELILLPTRICLTLICTIPKIKDKYDRLAKLSEDLLTFITLIYLFLSLWISVTQPSETAMEYLTLLALYVGFIPFLFLWHIFVVYQNQLGIIRCNITDQKLVCYAKWLAIVHIRGNSELLIRWTDAIIKSDPKHKSDLKNWRWCLNIVML